LSDANAFIVKDSGKRELFDSGMQRDTTEGKRLWHLVMDGPMLPRWADQLTKRAVPRECIPPLHAVVSR
jgi:hypothetical protein